MKKYSVFLSMIVLSGLFFLLQSTQYVYACGECEKKVCVDWNSCCTESCHWEMDDNNTLIKICTCNSCCEEYGCEDIDGCSTCDNSCDGSCTLKCPTGQSTTVTGDLCKKNKSSCTYKNDCDNTCTKTGAYCYLPENNTAPDAPTSVGINVGVNTYTLSLVKNSPTKIKKPMEDELVTLTEPTFIQPLTSRGIGYYFRVFEEITENNYLEILSSEEPTADPLTDPNISNTETFTDADQLLDGGFSGKLAGLYYTYDQCTYTVDYSTPLEGFFIVDNVPETPGPNPNVCDSSSEVCDKYDYLPELGSQITSKGCTSNDYVGLDINNPLKFQFSLSDIDGNSELRALVLWFHSKTSSESIPKTMNIVETNTGIDNNDFGIMIRDVGADGFDIYQSNTDNTWVKITDNNLKDITGATTASLLNLSVDKVTNPYIETIFDIEFLPGTNPINGEYEVYTQALDLYQIYGTTTEVDRLDHIFDFGIDLVNPVVENTQLTVNSVKDATFSWTSDDGILGSGIYERIVNGYVINNRCDSDPNPDLNCDIDINGTTIPTTLTLVDEYVGHFTEGIPVYVGSDETNIDINDNDQGSIDLYITAYDYACNYNGASDQIVLEPWFATKGGTFYSKSGVKTDAKDISTATIENPFINFTLETVTQGTELLSARSAHLYQLIHPELGGVGASLIYDSNNRKGYWYNHLYEKFTQQQNDVGTITLQEYTNGSTCTECLIQLSTPYEDCPEDRYCYYKSDGDISLSNDYTCRGNKAIISDGDISINPISTEEKNETVVCSIQSVLIGYDDNCETTVKDLSLIRAQPVLPNDCEPTPIYEDQYICQNLLDENSSCIYLAKEDINIGGGDYFSTLTDIQYDYLEGFFIAEGQINIVNADTLQDIRDGLEIKGGLVALGNGTTTDAIKIDRNLRLYNLMYPTLLVNYDFEYGKTAEHFFGTEADIYKQEVGFKNI